MKKVMVILFVIACYATGFGQKALYRKAEKRVSRFEFVGAAFVYKKIVRRYPKDKQASERLAFCYRMLNYHETQQPLVRREMHQDFYVASLKD